MNIGLVLSGGMAKGAYQIGALQAISKYFKPSQIQFISSASIGSVIAYAFSSNQLEKAENIWKQITENQEKVFITHFFRNENLSDILQNLDSLPINSTCFYFPLFQLKERKNLYIDLVKINQSDMFDYLNAAIAVFPFSKPFKIANEYYYDGAIIDNIPVYPLVSHQIDLIICVYFDNEQYIFETPQFDNRIIKIAFNENNILSDSLWFSKKRTEYMLQNGFEKADALLKYIFFDNTTDLQVIYQRIHSINQTFSIPKVRITEDVVLNNINNFAKRIVRREIR